jgi:YidC/Oxa1 family membrane protein insertase
MGTAGQSDNPTMRTMNIMMPLMILYFGITMSAGLTLYWVISTLFQIVQQVVMSRLTKEAKTL